MNKVQIFITHYVTKNLIELNDILVEEIQYLEHTTKYPHETIVVYYDEDGSANELYDRLAGLKVKLIRNDRPGRNDIQPSLRNKVIDIVDNDSYFVLLHNDIRVTVGWLDNLISDMVKSESIYGNGNVVLTPRYVPYHYIGSKGDKSENENFVGWYPKFWSELEKNIKCSSLDQIGKQCEKWNIKFDGINVHSPRDCKDNVSDNGHQLMMFISRKKFFDEKLGGIGMCDENFIGWGYDDQDWGIRALLAGKKNLQCHGCLIGHIEGLTFYNKNTTPRGANHQIFIDKWGRAMFDEMQTGQLWIRLHKDQR